LLPYNSLEPLPLLGSQVLGVLAEPWGGGEGRHCRWVHRSVGRLSAVEGVEQGVDVVVVGEVPGRDLFAGLALARLPVLGPEPSLVSRDDGKTTQQDLARLGHRELHLVTLDHVQRRAHLGRESQLRLLPQRHTMRRVGRHGTLRLLVAAPPGATWPPLPPSCSHLVGISNSRTRDGSRVDALIGLRPGPAAGMLGAVISAGASPDGGSTDQHLDALHATLHRIEQLLSASGRQVGEAVEHRVGRLPAWQRRTGGEHRWAVSTAVVAAIGLQALLPDAYVVHPRFLLEGVVAALLIGLIIANPTYLDREHRALRLAGLALIALISAANIYSAGRLVHALLYGSAGHDPTRLLLTGAQLCLPNVPIFSLP